MNHHQDSGQMLNLYLAQARELADQDQFEEALNRLREGFKLPGVAADEEGQINALEAEIEEKRRERVQTLTDDLEELLRQGLENLTKDDLQQGKETLAHLNRIHPFPTDLDSLDERWQIQRRRAELLMELETTRRRLEELWQSPYVILSNYDQALALARQKTQAFPDEPLVQELLAEARARRKAAYDQEGELTTQAATGNFGMLLKELQRLEAEGYQELPWYEWGTRESDGKTEHGLVPRENVPAQEAIGRVIQLATEYEDDKAKEYIQRARAELPVNPDGAAAWIGEAQAFEYISPSNRDTLQTFYDETVAPALGKRRLANELVEDAQHPGKAIEEAWDLLDQATDEDPDAPEIARARDEVRPRFKLHLEGRLRWAVEKRQSGDFKTAEEIASAVHRTAEADPSLADVADQAQALIGECDADRVLFEALEKDAAEIKILVDSDLVAAAQALADLEAKATGRPDPFQRVLEGARHTVQARQSLERLLADWERRFQVVDPNRLDREEKLRQALGELDRIDEEISQAVAKRGRDRELLDFQGRARGRRDFIQGRLDWEQGLYQRARNAWAGVVQSGRDDASLAKGWLSKAEDATAVSAAIDQAQAYHANRNYREALNVLRDWRTKASPKQREVRQLYQQIEGEWTGKLEDDIQELIVHLEQRPAYAELEEHILQLENLDKERARAYKFDYLVTIYEEWGDQCWNASQYIQADRYYGKAVDLASGQNRARLAGKRYRTRREYHFYQAEELINQDKRPGARGILATWLGEAPNDVPGLAWLADLFLEDEESERALSFIQRLERRLDAAEREENPLRAGLEQAEEITEWRLRLEALRRKAVAVADIRQAKRRVEELLQPYTNLREYRQAQETRDALIEDLSAMQTEMREQERKHPLLASLSPEAQERARHWWRRVRRWFDDQVRVNAGFQAWYAHYERDLLRRLREAWGESQATDVESLDFRAASPGVDLRRRWDVGLKTRFLFRASNEGETALREIISARGRLQRVVEQFTKDERGPEYSLVNEKLEPPEALEAQLNWSEHLLDWTALLSGLLESYAWATERAGEDEGQEPKPYQHAREIRHQIEGFRKALLDLWSAVRQARGRLDQAMAAGRDSRQRWGHVPWSAVAARILRYSSAPLPVEGGRELSRDYWQNLEHGDVGIRWSAWRKAADMLQEMRLLDRPQTAPWEEINQVIFQTGIEEKWRETCDPLQEQLVRFGRHRTVEWILKERDQAKAKRDQLVLATVTLYTLVQAEAFRAGLSQMERMESLDSEDDYGLRSGCLIKEPEPLRWEKIKEQLKSCQEQWQVFQEWWAEVEHSALRPWQDVTRTEVIGLMRRAEEGPDKDDPGRQVPFGAAEVLCRDALYGAQAKGRTNRLGGGLALEPLWVHLQKPPPDLQPPLSHRLRQALAEIASWRHDVQEAVEELRFWLTGEEGRHRPSDFPEPIQNRRGAFLAEKEALDSALETLQYSHWWPWQRRAKEDQCHYCLELLASLRRLAPEWPALETYEREIREA